MMAVVLGTTETYYPRRSVSLLGVITLRTSVHDWLLQLLCIIMYYYNC